MPGPRIAQIQGLQAALDLKLEGVVSLGQSADGFSLVPNTINRIGNVRRIKGSAFLTVLEFDNYLELVPKTGNVANSIVTLDNQTRLPAVNASLLTNLTVTNLVGSKQFPLSLINLPQNQFLVGDSLGVPAATPKNQIPLSGFGLPVTAVNMGEHKIVTTAVTFAVNELVSRAYVDNVAQGVSPRAPVRVATVTNINLDVPGFQVDGLNMVNGDRILVKEQNDPTENGVYVWTGQAVLMLRAPDCDDEIKMANMEVFVQDGTYAGQKWRLENVPPLQIGVTEFKYFQTYASLDYTAGAGLRRTGRQFYIDADGVTLGIGADNTPNNNYLFVRSTAVAGQVLRSTGVSGDPATWGQLNLADGNSFTGVLPFLRGGTGLGVLSQHSLVGAITAGNTYQGLSIPVNSVAGRLAGNLKGLNRAELKELLGLRRGVINTNCVPGQMMIAEILDFAPSDTNSVQVFLNGQALRKDVDWTIDVNSKVWATNALNELLGGTGSDGQGLLASHWILVLYDY